MTIPRGTPDGSAILGGVLAQLTQAAAWASLPWTLAAAAAMTKLYIAMLTHGVEIAGSAEVLRPAGRWRKSGLSRSVAVVCVGVDVGAEGEQVHEVGNGGCTCRSRQLVSRVRRLRQKRYRRRPINYLRAAASRVDLSGRGADAAIAIKGQSGAEKEAKRWCGGRQV